MLRHRSFASLLASLALIAACGGGDGTSPNPPVTQGGFTLTLSSSTLSVEQGASGSVTATIARSGSFTGAVTLSAENVPSGLSASFTPNPVAAGATSVTLAVSATAAVVAGNYSFVVRGQASGMTDQTGTVSVTVTAKPAIAMTLSAATGSVAAGGNVSLTATVARTNFAGAVTVAVTGAPTGVTPAVSSNGDSHAIAVAVAASTAPGTYPLIVTASGTGVTAVTATYTLTVTAAAAPSIALTATPPALSVQAGGTGATTTLAITRINFGGTVVVAVQSGLPAGVTATNNPGGPVSGNSVAVTFVASAAAVPGTYNVVLQGAGFQATPGTVTVALTITPAASGASVALSASPAALSIAPGSGTTTVINIARTNFTGTVNLAASGAPAAVTLTMTTTQTTGNSATLGIAAGASAATGTYPITVTASGNGIATTQVTIPVTITNASSGGNVVWTFCTATGFPVWFAYQDGGSTSPWTQVALSAGNRYAFDIGTRGAVAVVMQNNPDNYTLNVTYGSRAELASQGTATCPAPGSILKTVNGTVTGFTSANDFATVGVGSAMSQVSPTQGNPNFTISGVPDGLRDLVATRSAFNAANLSNPLTVTKIYVRRGINPPNFSSVGTVDFNASEAFDPATTQLTVNGIVAGETVAASNTFITNTTSFGSLGSSTLTTGSVLDIKTVPSNKTQPLDVQALTVNAATIAGSLATQIRSVTAVFRDPSNPTVTLGSAIGAPTISSISNAPYARLRAQFARLADYQDFWSATFTQTATASRRSVTITVSSAYAGAGTSLDLSIPDFTGVGGWNNAWGPIAGNLVNWNVAMTGWISANGGLVDGALYRIGQRQGTFTP
ncbi:MAG: hypothetical protein IT359_01275 [Gemmatimonadaceae bacterium]|nr:hypothetical protein [Gemmatimonadaceae bacterium]